eukprot:TRINITY_DN2340_c0_g2_i2.p1 TRINITY_DN2340_c0_g2~~TRINITY_DN2340_c0_g2_i2.p1  ORF type:complete len:409 (+),score=106.40 TRINITY_DN2340_c0_g2_i2:230-1456(+)
MNFQQRMEHCLNKRKKELASLAMKVMTEEKMQCTFTPRINSHTRRSLNEFLTKQKEFLESKAAKIKNEKISLMEKEEQSLRGLPKINSRSLLICSAKSRTKSVHKSHGKLEVEKVLPVKPKRISKPVRSTTAKSIKQIKEETQALQQKKEEDLSKAKKKAKENELFKNKINRELDNLLSTYNPRKLPLTLPMLCITLVYILGNMMKGFGMVREQKEESLVKALFQTISKEKASVEALKEAILIILRTDYTKNKFFNAAEIQRKFNSFYLNKISQPPPVKVAPKSPRTPKINSNSAKLAENYKKKCKQLINGLMDEGSTVEDMLIATRTAKEQKAQILRSKRVVEEFKNCTFRPEITAKGVNTKGKCQSPQNLAKRKLPVKSREEVEYERVKDELTFAPLINRCFVVCL